MLRPFSLRPTSIVALSLTMGALVAFVAAPAHALITFGQLDNFSDGTTAGWSEGSPTPNPPTNIGSSGPAGASDAYLQNIAAGFGPGNPQVMFNHAQWTGDYNTAGVTRIEMNLANFGTSPLAIRLAVTGGLNGGVYSSTTAIAPAPNSGWQTAAFNLTPSAMTSIGALDALSNILASMAEVRILSAIDGPGRNGDGGDSKLGVDNLRATRRPGDATFDNLVNFDDLLSLAKNYGATTGGT